jgi:hypothetical protein
MAAQVPEKEGDQRALSKPPRTSGHPPDAVEQDRPVGTRGQDPPPDIPTPFATPSRGTSWRAGRTCGPCR